MLITQPKIKRGECMSYMNQAAFANAGEIQELNFDEINVVSGGPAFLIPLGAWIVTNAVPLIAAGTTIAVATIAYVGVTQTDDCTTYNYYDKEGRLIKTRTVYD